MYSCLRVLLVSENCTAEDFLSTVVYVFVLVYLVFSLSLSLFLSLSFVVS